MSQKDYNRLFAEAEALADARAQQLGRKRVPSDGRAAVDEVYVSWLKDSRLDELISVLEGMFSAIGILSYRLEFLTDLRLELEERRDADRIISLFERTIPGVWRAYQREVRMAKEGLFGNIAEAATRKAELLKMLYEYYEAVYKIGDLELAKRIKEEGLRLSRDEKFEYRIKTWRQIP